MITMFSFIKYLKNYKKQLIIGPLFKLAEAVIELFVPIITALIIDNGIANNDTGYIWRMGALLLLLGAVGLVCALICQYNASVVSQGFGTILREELYKHINTFSHREIDKFSPAELITRLTNDVNQLQLAVAMLIRLVIRAPFLAVGAVVMAIIIDVKLSVIFLIIVPLIGGIIYFIMKRSVVFFKAVQKNLDNVSNISREGLAGAQVIRAFVRQDHEMEKFDNAVNEHTEMSVKAGKISALMNPLTFAVMNLGIAAVIWFGAGRVDSGDMKTGEIVAFINYITQVYLAITVVAFLAVIFTKASAGATRINEVFAVKNTVNYCALHATTQKATEKFKNAGSMGPVIEFKNVNFSYVKDNKYVLKNISLKIERGQTVGIIGGTGSGKTSLINLLGRFYDTDDGEILINSVKIKDYPLERLRSIIGIVPQNPVVFSGTIESNLKWGNANATKEDMIKSLEIAQAAEFVNKLPEGLKTVTERGGRNFSGGQKQRLTIARTIIQNSDILILDDSMSSLDHETEDNVRKAIKDKLPGVTTLIVSQRIASIKDADCIIVLEEGEIAGMGTHEQLVENCKVYKEIYSSQV